jgi:transcriptional regulator with GAF, ATPase, and Fis domain
MSSIWVCALDERARSRRSTIAAELEAAGLHLRRGPERKYGPGLAIFAEAPEAVRTVRSLSDDGRLRVVAVPLEDNVPPWELLAAGAADVMAWRGPETAEALAARFDRWRQIDELVESPLVSENLVGEHPSWRAVLRDVVEVARFTDSSVLITGESGTGKELVARLIHALDAREDKGELVVVDCTTVVPTLSGSEFFGHVRGAFTGAAGDREGAFGLADGGTLFLDEVGELPLPLQAELLRVVQEGTYKKVGSDRWQSTSFRLVCATNRDLLAEEAEGRFRRDFYYRIAGWTCRLPSLRERRSDVLRLADHFLAERIPQRRAFDWALREHLNNRDYPGNVRDLRQLMLSISHRCVGAGPITIGSLPISERNGAAPKAGQGGSLDDAIERALAAGVGLKELLAQTREIAIRLAIEQESGNIRRASSRLGVTDRAIHMARAAERGRRQTAEVTVARALQGSG